MIPDKIELQMASEAMPPAMLPSNALQSASGSASCNRSEPPDSSPSNGLQERSLAPSQVSSVINSVKKQVAADRCDHIKRRMEENRQKVADLTSNFLKAAQERRYLKGSESNANVDLLTKRQQDAVDMQNGIDTCNGDDDSNSSQEDGHGSVILLGSSIAVKNAVRPIRLPEVKKIPPYTTWVFLDRNQRMTEDQSVFGRRRIYYDQTGGEALVASDSDEEVIDEDAEKKEFVDSEDKILRTTISEVGLSDAVLDALAQCFSRKPCEVKARYEVLLKRENASMGSQNLLSEDISCSFLDKNLDAALDSFDNLFCRRCLVFDCRLHGCSQDLILPAEKQLSWSCPDEGSKPCGSHCYRVVLKSEGKATASSPARVNSKDVGIPSSDGTGSQISRRRLAGPSLRRRAKPGQSGSATSNARTVSESSDSESRPLQDLTGTHPTSSPPPKMTKLGEKSGIHKRNSIRLAEHVLNMRKRQKKLGMASESDSLASGSPGSGDTNTQSNLHKENEDASSCSQKIKSSSTRRSTRKDSPSSNGGKLLNGKVNDSLFTGILSGQPVPSSDDTLKEGEFVDESICKEVNDVKLWRTLEKALLEKGLEIFGRNSCLIARNFMNGMKTCSEVFQFMNHSENKLSSGAGNAGNGLDSLGEGSIKGDGNETGTQLRRRSRFLRRRGRVRRLKYTWKSSGYHSFRKRISERKDQPCRQYNPCGCPSACGKECSCLLNGTCCEKYCGCPRTCKNRFRGCHCAKSQCRSRQCPCFAAGRECDPDVCRNCWISCGDGTLGNPWQRGDNYECRNMKLLLKQQQRVLLGKSDVSGWGAFLKKSVAKHEYLGEYTGELISHREADKRGKIYDRVNSSFLFNLNDQYVLDAYRKGDKLKFANHSPDPNCYAKVMMVAGDHRVGIFAKERISAGEELFYDYRYEADRAPAWAKKPEASGRKDDHAPSTGRAKKIA